MTRTLDVKARRLASDALRGFLDGLLSNQELDLRYPEASADRAVHEVYVRTWPYQDDVAEFRLGDQRQSSPDERALFERCVLFLESDLPYEWPSPWERARRYIASLRWGARSGQEAREEGAREVWPFFREREWEHAARRPAPET